MSNMEASTGITAGKPKSKTKGNKKAEKEKDPKGKTTKPKGKEVVLNYAKFDGQGLSYKCKLFGFAEVSGPRGDRACVEAIQKLKQQAKQLKKGANEHKLKIVFNITLQGVKVINEKTQTVAHQHQIHKISFISHDPDDRHIFGYIYNPPRRTPEERKYYLFAIKAEKSADAITSQLYELFQVVYKMQENKKARSKDNTTPNQTLCSQPLEPLQDKMLLEMSSRLGGEQHHQIEEHLYAEPTFVKRSVPVSPKAHYDIPSGRPAPTANESNSKEYENLHEKNSNGEVENEMLSSEFASSPFTQDPSSPSATEENQSVSDKEANMNMQSPQVISNNVSTPSINEDSGFEPGFDSAASSISTEPKVDDSFQFQTEFPPFQNGFSISKADLKDTNHSAATDVFGGSNYSSSSTDQFQAVALKNGMQLENTFDINGDIERNDRESLEVDVEGTKVSISSSKSNDKPHFENAKEEEVSSESNGTFSSDDVQPEVNQNVGTLSSLERKIPADVEKSNNAKQDETSDTKKENKNISFEAKFDTGINETNATAEKSDGNAFSSFNSDPEAFPNEDPFSSSSAAEDDMSSSFGVFLDDDPFSPQGGTNKETVSDPFAESDDFDSDFTCTAENNDDEFSKENENVFFSQTNRETEITVENNEDDIFEAMFEAKIEKGMEELSKDENEAIAVPSVVPRKNNIKMKEQSSAASENTESKMKEQSSAASGNTDSNGDETITSSENDSQNDKVEGVSEKVAVDIQVRGEEESEMNTFDLTTNDDYVTLKKAVSNENRSLSPSELSPPPLPPRPTPPVNIERSDYEEIPLDHVLIPKEPPALPPRPSNQSLNTEHVIRKPPELPPRVDLENTNSYPFADSVEDSKTESAPNDAASTLFQSNFDSFDFNNAENNTETTVELQGSTTAEFDSADPFKDPFVGADPFQTPIAADPFASTPSLDQSYKRGSDGFDPFSDDPFAATPSFDSHSSFDLPNSPFPAQPSFEEPKEDQDNDKQFADFSSAFN